MPAVVSAGLLVLATSVYGLGTLSTSVPRWVVIYLFACVALLWFVRQSWRRSSIVLDRTDAAALAFVVYAGLSLLWSKDQAQGVYAFVNLTALALIAVWVRHAPREQVALLPGAAGVALFAAFIGHFAAPWDYGGHGNRLFQSDLMLVAWMLGLAVLSDGARFAVFLCGLPVAAYLLLENGSKSPVFVAVVFGGFLIVRGIARVVRRRPARALDQHLLRLP